MRKNRKSKEREEFRLINAIYFIFLAGLIIWTIPKIIPAIKDYPFQFGAFLVLVILIAYGIWQIRNIFIEDNKRIKELR